MSHPNGPLAEMGDYNPLPRRIVAEKHPDAGPNTAVIHGGEQLVYRGYVDPQDLQGYVNPEDLYVDRDDLEAPARRAFAASQGRVGDWMQTAHGRKFWVMDPRAEEVFIEDIGWQLSLICRYNGCCGIDEPLHYSVAQHSVLVSRVLEARGYVRATQLEGLLHDAPEAYCCDIHRPLKRNLREYGPIEHRIWQAIAERFGLSPELDAVIKEADNDVLLAEQAQIMKPSPEPWHVPGSPAEVLIEEITPKQAYRMFMERFKELTS